MRLRRTGLKVLFLFFFFTSTFLSGFERPGPRHAAASASDFLLFAPSSVSTRPKMVFIDPPGIFYAPDSPYNLYRRDRTWYYYYDEKWYQSDRHDGSWRYLPSAKVPDALKNLPDRYLKKENRTLPAEAEPPKGKKGKSLQPKKKMNSSPKKIFSPRPLSS
jgi:hypothetical protein